MPNNTLHLVDPEHRVLAAQFPIFDPSRHKVDEYRGMIVDGFAQLAPAVPANCEPMLISGSSGRPAVRILIHRPTLAGPSMPAVLYIHGGGFIAGTADMMGGINAQLAENIGAVIVSVDYHRAPEAIFPDPLEDCYEALRWLILNSAAVDVDPTRIVILGDSAGGGLAAACSLLARDRSVGPLMGQVLIYPMLDSRTGSDDEVVHNPHTGEFTWDRRANHFGWEAMRGNQRIALEHLGYFSPAQATDLTCLPPTYIMVGSLDLFLEENVAYALRLARAGGKVECHIYDGGIHGFDRLPGTLATRANRELVAALRRLLSI